MKALEEDADSNLKTLKENDMDDRMEKYAKAMETEINERKKVIELLAVGKEYYVNLYNETEVIVIEYRDFESDW